MSRFPFSDGSIEPYSSRLSGDSGPDPEGAALLSPLGSVKTASGFSVPAPAGSQATCVSSGIVSGYDDDEDDTPHWRPAAPADAGAGAPARGESRTETFGSSLAYSNWTSRSDPPAAGAGPVQPAESAPPADAADEYEYYSYSDEGDQAPAAAPEGGAATVAATADAPAGDGEYSYYSYSDDDARQPETAGAPPLAPRGGEEARGGAVAPQVAAATPAAAPAGAPSAGAAGGGDTARSALSDLSYGCYYSDTGTLSSLGSLPTPRADGSLSARAPADAPTATPPAAPAVALPAVASAVAPPAPAAVAPPAAAPPTPAAVAAAKAVDAAAVARAAALAPSATDDIAEPLPPVHNLAPLPQIDDGVLDGLPTQLAAAAGRYQDAAGAALRALQLREAKLRQMQYACAMISAQLGVDPGSDWDRAEAGSEPGATAGSCTASAADGASVSIAVHAPPREPFATDDEVAAQLHKLLAVCTSANASGRGIMPGAMPAARAWCSQTCTSSMTQSSAVCATSVSF